MESRELEGLLERVRVATGPDRLLDAHVICALLAPAGSWISASTIFHAIRVCTGRNHRGADECWAEWPYWAEMRVTGSVDAVLALIDRKLPDFWHTSGLCALTGHASIGPDYNGPAGERLRREWPEEHFHEGFSADLAPGDGRHRQCYALLDCLLQALLRTHEAPNV